jgi:hypothetical protein
MKRLRGNENGFIPLLIAILVIVVIIIYIAYTRVHHLTK